jgi:excisionase family DNA binding protein
MADTAPATTYARPRWSATEAAKRAGVSRSTIQRMIADGRLEAGKDDEGNWVIALENLLAAGLKVDRPTTPEDAQTPAQGAPDPAQKVAELETELAQWKNRAQVAEAVAAERAERVADLRQALRMLEPTRENTPTEPAVPVAPVVQQVTHGSVSSQPRSGRRTWRQWWEDRRAAKF